MFPPAPAPPQALPPQAGPSSAPAGMNPQMIMALLMKLLGGGGGGAAPPVSSTMRTGIPFQGQPGPTDYAVRSLQRDAALKALLQLIGQSRGGR
jgi:hypothetical protein